MYIFLALIVCWQNAFHPDPVAVPVYSVNVLWVVRYCAECSCEILIIYCCKAGLRLVKYLKGVGETPTTTLRESQVNFKGSSHTPRTVFWHSSLEDVHQHVNETFNFTIRFVVYINVTTATKQVEKPVSVITRTVVMSGES